MLLFGIKNIRFRPTAMALVAALSVTLNVQFTVASAEPASAQKVSFDDNLVDAAEAGNVNAVTGLIVSGKFVDSRGKLETTALMRAVFNGNDEITNTLLSSGANPNLVDIGGASAMHIAARKGNVSAIGKLLSSGANPDIQDKEGWTPLMRAALYKQDAALEKLLKAGAKPNLTNMMKETALLHATFTGNANAVSMLLDHGADLRMKDENGLTAADISFQRGFSDVQEILAKQQPASAVSVKSATTNEEKKPEPLIEIASARSNKTVKEPDNRPDIALASAPEKPSRPEQQENSSAVDGYTDTGLPKPKDGFTFTPLPDVDETSAARQESSQNDAAPQSAEKEINNTESAPSGTHYMLQLGTFGTRRDAKERWVALQSANTDLLGSLHFVASEVVLRTDQRTVYRTQAGYFSSQKSADAVCEKLFARNIDCFVVESAGEVTKQGEPPAPLSKIAVPPPARNDSVDDMLASPPPQISTAKTEEKPVSMAAKDVELAKPKEAEKEKSQPEAPWEIVKKEGETKSAKAEQPEQKTAPAAPVELESLPPRSTFSSDVPVLENIPPAAPQIAETNPQPLQQLPARLDENNLPSNPANSSSWLQISGFSGTASAQEFWQEMQNKIDHAKNMRFRTIQPVQQRGGRYTSIRVGPVNSPEARTAICSFAAENNHDCRNIDEFSGDIRRSSSSTPAATTPASVSSNFNGSSYWVMLGSFHQQEDAEKHWSQLLTRNQDILKRFTPNLATPRYSSNGTDVLRLRVGPFAEHQHAANMCADLQGRGVRCLTVRD